ncbi:hypothetical protein LZC95_10785 [Pendulispora brunnea]|uniref:Tetratricopeptide repeat protein n=1 Tax=Pendulispora brunnea TaxID=2905690 RepID=A0ABZ2KF48_9BACT
MRKLGHAAVAAAFLVSVPLVARAQPTDHARAEQHFRAGRSLVLAGRCSEAMTELQRSIEFEPSVGAYLNLGDCSFKMRKLEDAWYAYKEAESLAQARNDARLGEIVGDLAGIERTVVRLVVRAPADATNLAVSVDGRTIARERLGQIIVDPGGDHTVVARADGKEPWQKTVRAAAGARVQLELDLRNRAVAVPPVAGAGEPRRAPAEGERSSGMRTAAYVVGGVGAAALVAGGVFGVLALSSRNELNDAVREKCGDRPCDPGLRGELDPIESRANTQATLSTVFIGAGAAAVVTGVVLWVVAPKRAKETAWSIGTGPDARSPLGVSVRGAF